MAGDKLLLETHLSLFGCAASVAARRGDPHDAVSGPAGATRTDALDFALVKRHCAEDYAAVELPVNRLCLVVLNKKDARQWYQDLHNASFHLGHMQIYLPAVSALGPLTEALLWPHIIAYSTVEGQEASGAARCGPAAGNGECRQ